MQTMWKSYTPKSTSEQVKKKSEQVRIGCTERSLINVHRVVKQWRADHIRQYTSYCTLLKSLKGLRWQPVVSTNQNANYVKSLTNKSTLNSWQVGSQWREKPNQWTACGHAIQSRSYQQYTSYCILLKSLKGLKRQPVVSSNQNAN